MFNDDSWIYAQLAKRAKECGGPEQLIENIFSAGKVAGQKSMYIFITFALIAGLGIGVGGTTVFKWVYKKVRAYFSNKRLQSDKKIEMAKQELIQGIKDYDAQHQDEDNDSSDNENE